MEVCPELIDTECVAGVLGGGEDILHILLALLLSELATTLLLV